MHVASKLSDLSASGMVDLDKNQIDFRGKGSTKDFLDFFSPYFTSLSGPATYQITLSGKLDDPTLAAQFVGTQDTFITSGPEIPDFMQRTTVQVDRFDGSVQYQKNVLKLLALATQTGNEKLHASGTVIFRGGKQLFDIKNPEYDLSIKAQTITIQNLVASIQNAPDLEGILDADFTVKGVSDALVMKGTAAARNFGVHDTFAFQQADTKFLFEKKRFFLSPLRLKTAGAVVEGTATLSLDKSFSCRLDGKNLNIAELLPEKTQNFLTKRNIRTLLIPSLHLAGTGTFDRPSISMQGEFFSNASRGQSIGKGTFTGALQGRKLDVSLSLLDNRAQLKAVYELRHPFPWSVSFDMASARGDFLLTSFFSDAPDDLIVNLKGHMEASGSKTMPIQGSLNLEKALVYAYGIGLSNASPIRALLKDQRLSFEPIVFRGENAELSITGGLHIEKNYDLHIQGKTALGPLKMMIRELDAVRGDANLTAAITGSWNSPRINGDLTISSAMFGFDSLPYRFTDVSGYVVFDEDKILIKQINGKFAGGDVAASGNVRLNQLAWDRFYFESTLKGSSFSLPQRLTAQIDGSLIYQGSRNKQNISGDIAIKRANYSQRIDLVSLIMKSRAREVPHKELSAFDQAHLNVKVTGQNITLQNNLAYALLTMDGYIRGTVAKPVLFGKVETTQGDVYFQNNEFRIQKATIDFADPMRNRPYISILATSRVSTYLVRLMLDGYPDQFAMSLASDPPLNESDIINLLALGRTGSQTSQQRKDSSGSIGLGGATSFLADSLQETIQERIKTVTGIDRVVIEPAVSRASGMVTPRVSAQKRMLNDKILVTYSAAAGSGEEQIWKVEYLLGKSTSLVGQRDEKGGVGGDIKFRFEFR
jgi:translocation and assembly module TamB